MSGVAGMTRPRGSRASGKPIRPPRGSGSQRDTARTHLAAAAARRATPSTPRGGGRRPRVFQAPRRRIRALATRSQPLVPASLVIELIAAGLHSGGSIPHVLVAVGETIDAEVGAALVRAGRCLLIGSSWREAWDAAPPELRVLEEALVHAWEFGAPAAEALRSARTASEREALARAKVEAQRLGVRLVVPLGLCFLPSFILLAVVPLVAILAGGGLF